MRNNTSTILTDRYQIQAEIGTGGMGAVYCAYDRLTGHDVALKRVSVAPEDLAFNSRTDRMEIKLALAHEFKTLSTLRHPYIISVLDYGFDQHHDPFFTMEYLPNATPISDYAHQLDDEHKIRLLIELLQGLDYLHRHGLLHRDLKPANILIQDDHIKIIDFGLAVEPDSAVDTVGTITYLAPELLEGFPASIASDLYPIGLIAYGMFAGRYPFDIDLPIDALLNEILFKSIDYTPIPQPIRSIIERLTARNPENRFQTAYDALIAVQEVAGQTQPAESAAIRESFLQAARFVGRDAELDQLRQGLAALDQGQGALWLVTGENGIGKSRLIEEFRAYALVGGASVLQGQAVEGADLPYQIWRQPLQQLVLSLNITDTEASILKSLVPDLERLIGRSIPDPPPPSEEPEHKRLIATIIGLFKRQSRPTVLIIEDLHWAHEGLQLLKALCEVLDQLPLLIVCTYLPDEQQFIEQMLPQAHHLTLTRMDRDSLAQLSVSMLGKAGAQPEIVNLLARETEGNIFFMVEVIRALAEEAGGLAQVGQVTLPDTVFAGGIQRIVQRRLQKVPAWAYAGLQLAAVAGRALDLHVLAHALPSVWQATRPDPELTLDEWLLMCSEAAILEVHDGAWRFAHDKLRNQLLIDMNPSQLRELHHQLAQTIESVYPDDALYATVLVEHWRQAGQPHEEKRYLIPAAEQSIQVGAIDEGIEYLLRALELGVGIENHQADLHCRLGHAYRLKGDYEQAIHHFEQVTTNAEIDSTHLVEAWIGLAWMHQLQGFDLQSLASAEEAERLLRTLDEPTLLAETLYHKGWALFRLGQSEDAKLLAQEGLALSSSVNARLEMAHHLNLLGIIESFVLHDYGSATQHQQQALAIHHELGDRYGEAIILNNLGETLRLQGDYESAAESYRQALDIARHIGDRDGEMAYGANLAGALVGLGDYAPAINMLESIVAEMPSDWYVLPDALCSLATAYLGQRRLKKAIETILQSLRIQSAAEESMGNAWRIAGQIASYAQQPLLLVDGTSYDAPTCFARSIDILQQAGMQRDLALTLLAWSRHERVMGNRNHSDTLWTEARTIFESLHLTIFLEQMNG